MPDSPTLNVLPEKNTFAKKQGVVPISSPFSHPVLLQLNESPDHAERTYSMAKAAYLMINK